MTLVINLLAHGHLTSILQLLHRAFNASAFNRPTLCCVGHLLSTMILFKDAALLSAGDRTGDASIPVKDITHASFCDIQMLLYRKMIYKYSQRQVGTLDGVLLPPSSCNFRKFLS